MATLITAALSRGGSQMASWSASDRTAQLLAAAIGGYVLGCFTCLVILPLLERFF
jgi:hypothetical protein